MTRRLNGWQRIGVVLSALWILIVSGYAIFELMQGPNSAMLFVQMVVSKTQEPVSALAGNQFRDLVPVEAQLRYGRLIIVVIMPVAVGWVLASGLVWTIRWIAGGFRSNDT